MKKLKYLLFTIGFMLCMIPNVNALDYTLESKWSGYTPGTTFWINSGYRDVGAYKYERPTNTGVGDYIDVSYCSSGNVKTYTVDRPEIQRDPIYLDTGEWCTTGQYDGTIKHNYYMVGNWTYTENSGYAYLEGGTGSYFYNTSSYSAHVLFYGIANISELDMSLSILAYLKSQEENIDYSDTLSQIQQNTNKYNQEIGIVQDKLNETNASINDMKDALTNDDVNNVESSFESFEGFISENSTITQLITMPITLYSSVLNGLQSTCQPFSLGNLFGTNLIFPCINIGNYLGSALWSMVDVIISGFAIFSISKKLIKIFNNFSSMKEGDVIDD